MNPALREDDSSWESLPCEKNRKRHGNIKRYYTRFCNNQVPRKLHTIVETKMAVIWIVFVFILFYTNHVTCLIYKYNNQCSIKKPNNTQKFAKFLINFLANKIYLNVTIYYVMRTNWINIRIFLTLNFLNYNLIIPFNDIYKFMYDEDYIS